MRSAAAPAPPPALVSAASRALAAACTLAALAGLPSSVLAQTCADWTPQRQPFFGDVHVHTALSFDAYTFETRNGPRDAYRFAKGETVGLPKQGQPSAPG